MTRLSLFDESDLAAIDARKLPVMRAALSAMFRADGVTPDMVAAVRGLTATPPQQAPDGIAVVPIHGVITQRSSYYSEIFGGTSLDRLQASLVALRDDSAVRSIVLHVNSPGGGVYGVDETAELIAEVGKRKRIVAFTDGLMASAAYWLASAAGSIVATPSAEIGSIGVYAVHMDYSENLKADGIAVTLIKAGEHKAEANPYQPLSDDDREAMQSRINAYHGMFTRRVAKGRGVPVEQARGEQFGAGRVLGASAAVSAGMADEVGSFVDVLRGLSRDTSSKAAAAADEALRYRVQLAQLAI